MKEILNNISFGVAIALIIGTALFGFNSCLAEDHRHSEEMRRLQLVEQECMNFREQLNSAEMDN